MRSSKRELWFITSELTVYKALMSTRIILCFQVYIKFCLKCHSMCHNTSDFSEGILP